MPCARCDPAASRHSRRSSFLGTKRRALALKRGRNGAAHRGGEIVQESVVVIVLVVDDDPAMQELASDTLSEAGFKTEVVSSGEEAVKLLNAPDAEYRALVTDVNLIP